MEAIGIVQAQRADRVLVRTEGTDPRELSASNPAGAEPGDRVRLEFPDPAALPRSYYLVPLLALFLAGGLGQILAGIESLTDPIKARLGPVLGPFLTAPDNLILFLGLLGLWLGTLWTRRYRRNRTPAAAVAILEKAKANP